MKITPTPKRLVAQRRRREGACCPKGHRQPSSRSKRDLLGRRSGDGAAKECPILNWVFREQRSPPRRGFPKGRVPLGASPVTPASAQQPSRTESKAPSKGASGLSGFTQTTGERAITPLPKQKQKPSLQPFLLTLKGTDQNCGRHYPGLTLSLLPQQWDSKGTSPFGRNPWHKSTPSTYSGKNHRLSPAESSRQPCTFPL